jgi:hypothetical protein
VLEIHVPDALLPFNVPAAVPVDVEPTHVALSDVPEIEPESLLGPSGDVVVPVSDEPLMVSIQRPVDAPAYVPQYDVTVELLVTGSADTAPDVGPE